MFDISIIILFERFLWKSDDETGFFLGTRMPNPIYVGSVPVVTVPYSIMNEGLFTTTTPSHTSYRPTNTVFSCGLSPIISDNRLSDTNNNVGNKKRKK